MKEWKAEMLEEEEKEQELESSEMSMADLLRGEEEVSEKLLSREVVRVKVVQVLEDQVLVDVGEKKEGVISRTEFKPGEIPAVGGEVPALLERKASEHSPAVLSYRKAKQVLAWAATQKAFQDKQRVRGRVMRQIKGGYLVDLDGISGFLPLSLSDMRPIHHHHLPVGALVRCYIQEMGKTGNRGARSGESNYHVVLSRKQVLEEDHKQRIQKAMEKLKVGGVYRGVVSQVKEFGFFVGLGGLEGLVHILDCAWKEPNRALKSFRRGQRVQVKVLKMDLENGKVNLGIKQLLPNPADELRKYFP
ncbi:MAG: S1 RNA-binding domain-containing protein, partial [Elusimicrobia bacterium]|nr:S1 RNA-binding domain-containing protein [Elusimicrobiota bacterium]